MKTIDLLTILYENPGRFARATTEVDRKKIQPMATMVIWLVALSIAVGSLYPMSQTGGNWLQVIIFTLSNYFFLEFFGLIYGLILHHRLADEEDYHPLQQKQFLLYVRYSLSLFLLYTPLSIISYEMTGGVFERMMLCSLILLILFFIMISRGINAIIPQISGKNSLTRSMSVFLFVFSFPFFALNYYLNILFSSIGSIKF